MNDFDRSWLMSRTGASGGSMEQLINMAHEGNVNNLEPWREPVRITEPDYNSAALEVMQG